MQSRTCLSGAVVAANVADRAVEPAGGDASADVAIDVRARIGEQGGASCGVAPGGVQSRDGGRARAPCALILDQSGAFCPGRRAAGPPLFCGGAILGALERRDDERRDDDRGRDERRDGQHHGTS